MPLTALKSKKGRVIRITQPIPKDGALNALFSNLSQSGRLKQLCSKMFQAPSFWRRFCNLDYFALFCVNNVSVSIFREVSGYCILVPSLPRFTTVYHGLQRFTMVYHGLPWFTTVYHGLPQFTPVTTVYHDLPRSVILGALALSAHQ